jgi:hypothetical protein
MPLDETQRSLAMTQIAAALLSRNPGAARQDSETLAREAGELLRAIENEAALPQAHVHDSPHARQ